MKRLYFALTAALFTLTCAVTFVLHYNEYRAYNVPALSADAIACPAEADKLMIVAHPDDETLWGGAHLLDGGWLVVSITHGSDSTRSAEFAEAVTASGNTPLMLSYPDKVNLRRDDWSQVSGGIEADIATLLQYKDWQTVATHNPAGEYGHLHHKRTNAIVAAAAAGDRTFTGTVKCGENALVVFAGIRKPGIRIKNDLFHRVNLCG